MQCPGHFSGNKALYYCFSPSLTSFLCHHQQCIMFYNSLVFGISCFIAVVLGKRFLSWCCFYLHWSSISGFSLNSNDSSKRVMQLLDACTAVSRHWPSRLSGCKTPCFFSAQLPERQCCLFFVCSELHYGLYLTIIYETWDGSAESVGQHLAVMTMLILHMMLSVLPGCSLLKTHVLWEP